MQANQQAKKKRKKREYNNGVIKKWQRAKARLGGGIRYAGADDGEARGVAGETGTSSDTVLLHSAVSLRRRQLCRPNSVLFMQKPSQKVLGLKAVQADAQLFIKQRNVS